MPGDEHAAAYPGDAADGSGSNEREQTWHDTVPWLISFSLDLWPAF